MEGTTTQTINFLVDPSIKRLRKEIKNICDSYSHPWDILAELVQNSVDAILLYDKRFGETHKKEHKIEIEINALERSIRIRDTGTGFSPERFSELLAPHGTDKDTIFEAIGEKGVGLTYTIFVSNEYQIDTKSTEAHIKGIIKNASLWKDGKIDDMPVFEVIQWEEREFDPTETFTEILIRDVDKFDPSEHDIFNQSIHVIQYLLRTKTAIGWLKGIFENKNLNIKVKLIHIDGDNNRTELNLPMEYMLPEEFISPSDVIELDEFKKTASALDDMQKAKKLQGKAIIKKGFYTRAGRRINFYAFFAPSRNLWKEISEKSGLFIVQPLSKEKEYLYQGGIYIATKGMPTGITIEPPVTGFSGYWPNFYIILEDDRITFDVGRKSIPGRTKGTLKEIAKEIFQEFIPFIKYTTSNPQVTSSTIIAYQKYKEFEELKKLPDLGIDEINYLKHPDGQEAAIVALFHELVAAGILKGYYTLRMGYKQTYDLWGIYRIEKSLIGSKWQEEIKENIVEMPIIIEFKYNAEDILADVEKNRKYFSDIDLIVCWDLNETKFAKHSVTVEPLKEEEVLFYGSNYKLTWPGAYNLGPASEKPVLALRKFIQDYLGHKHGHSTTHDEER